MVREGVVTGKLKVEHLLFASTQCQFVALLGDSTGEAVKDQASNLSCLGDRECVLNIYPR